VFESSDEGTTQSVGILFVKVISSEFDMLFHMLQRAIGNQQNGMSNCHNRSLVAARRLVFEKAPKIAVALGGYRPASLRKMTAEKGASLALLAAQPLAHTFKTYRAHSGPGRLHSCAKLTRA
jgi:hypothetical protein